MNVLLRRRRRAGPRPHCGIRRGASRARAAVMRLSFRVCLSRLACCVLGLQGAAACRCVPPGAEDLERVPWRGGPALVTGVDDSRRGRAGRLELSVPGGAPGFRPVFTAGRLLPFRPVGLCAVDRSRDPRWPGGRLLYVANALPWGHSTVEVFAIRDAEILHLGNLGPLPFGEKPNAVAAFPDGTVFASYFSISPLRGKDNVIVSEREEDHTGSRSNRVVVYTSSGPARGWRTAVSGLAGGNGLAAGPGDHSLLVCSYFSKTIRSFERDAATGRLNGKYSPLPVRPHFYPDNIRRRPGGGGAPEYEMAGQRGVIPTALALLTRLPVSPGGALAFRWDGETLRLSPDSEDRDRAARRDGKNPATLLREGNFFYISSPLWGGVRRVQAAPAELSTP